MKKDYAKLFNSVAYTRCESSGKFNTEVFQVIACWLALVSRYKATKLKPLEDGEELSKKDTLGFLTPEVRCEI